MEWFVWIMIGVFIAWATSLPRESEKQNTLPAPTPPPVSQKLYPVKHFHSLGEGLGYEHIHDSPPGVNFHTHDYTGAIVPLDPRHYDQQHGALEAEVINTEQEKRQ